MKNLSFIVLSVVIWNHCEPSSAIADDDKWKIGRGRVLRQLFGGSESNEKPNNKQQQPTPAAQQPPASFRQQEPGRPQMQAPQPNQFSGNRPPQQPNLGNPDPRRNPNFSNQQMTAAQQQRAQWEAQQRAAQRQQQGQQPNRNPLNVWGNQNTPANQANQRGGQPSSSDPRRGANQQPNTRLTSSGSKPNPNEYRGNEFGTGVNQNTGQNFDNRQMAEQGNRNQPNNSRSDKRRGPKPVGFGLELKADRNDQIFVAKTDKNGNAENIGLRRGDQILQIGGVDLTTVEEFSEIEKIMQDGDQIELKVQRSGKTANVVLTFGEGPQESDFPPQGESDMNEYRAPYNGSEGAAYDFVPRQNEQERIRGNANAPRVDPRAFESPRPPANLPSSRPNLHELDLDWESNFELPPRSSGNSGGSRSVLEIK